MRGLNLKEDRGGDKAGALILSQYGGPRCVWPERLSSTNVGSQVRVAGALILNQYGVAEYGFPGAWSQSEEDGGGGRRQGQGRRAYPQPIWVSEVRGLSPKKVEARQGRSAYPQPIWGSQVRGLNLKKTEARTRPERLSSANMGVPGAYGLNAYPQPMWGPRCVWPGRLSSTNMGRRVWVPRCMVSI